MDRKKYIAFRIDWFIFVLLNYIPSTLLPWDKKLFPESFHSSLTVLCVVRVEMCVAASAK